MIVATLEEAAAWVDRVGLALVFPKDDLVLPSLWYAAGGADTFSVRDEEGGFVRWVEPMGFVWGAKSELPGQGLCCGGNHLRGRASLISHDLLPALVAVHRSADEPSEAEREVLDLLASAGPTSTRELPELLPHRERKTVRAALDRLQRRLLVTNAGLEETDGWPANVVDLVDRRYADRLRSMPPADEARRILAERLLASARELSAADLAAVFAWRKKESQAVLESLPAEARDDQGTTVWLASA
jgi:chromosome segregation and condensation protein ScpB